MASNSYNGFQISTFDGGINQGIDEMYIKKNFAKDAQNIDITTGTMKRCSGVEKYSALSPSYVTKIDTIIPFFDDTSSSLLLCGNGYVEEFNIGAGTFKLLLSNMQSNYYDYVNFKQIVAVGNEGIARVVIFTNGKDPVKMYDGVTVTDLKQDGWQSAASESNRSPKGKFIDLHYDRVWISGDDEFPDRLFFSTASQSSLDPQDWTIPLTEEEANMHGGEIDIPTWDGGKIIGMKVLFDDVVIFKNYSVFKIYGSDPSSYGKSQIFSSKGAIADNSIIAADDKAFFLTKDGIYMYDGVNVANISKAIDPIVENMNQSYVDKAVGAYNNNRYILAVPEGSSTTNNMVIEYNILTKSFMVRRGMNIKSFAMYNNELIFCNGDDGFVYRYDSGDTIDGSAISSYYETGETDLGYPDSKKTLQHIFVTARGSGTIKITCHTDLKGDRSTTLALSESVKIEKVKLKNKGRILNIKIENVDGCFFEVKSLKLIMDVDMD